jgi:hypothetical protein
LPFADYGNVQGIYFHRWQGAGHRQPRRSDMLRKFFHSSGAPETAASSGSLDAAKKTEGDNHGGRSTDFSEMVERLERFEGGNGSGAHVSLYAISD